MALYEYLARDCPYACDRILTLPIESADSDTTKRLYDDGRMSCPHGVTYRRLFTPRISKYRAVANPGTADQREFTSEREYARHLRTESAKATDYTGIPHSFVPTDPSDPDMQPADDAAQRNLHDRLVREGKREPTMRIP